MTIAKWTTASIASLSLLLVGAIGIGMPSNALAQEEWEQSTTYYEDDAWYDVSEWLDGNDYNPTDEVVGNWNDEVYDAENLDTDRDSDDEYGYYSDTSEYYNDEDDWYYDYYDDSYVYDDYGYDDGVYTATSDYYDYDDDGIYDAYASYYDWDGDGLYEDYNYYTFTSLEDADQQTQTADKQARQQAKQKQQQKSSKEYEVTGQVQKTKKVQVRDGKNMVAQVKTDQGMFNVDLGPVKQASNWNVSQGTQLAARGPVSKIGDKQVLLAKSAQIGQKQVSIDRSDIKSTGTIKSLKKADVRGTQHQLAMIDTKDKQQKVLVDMGPANKLSQNFSEGDEVTVHGVPVRINQKPVLMAQKVKYQGETINIDRSKKQNQQSSNDQAPTNG